MDRTTYVLRSLRFHRRTHLGVLAGCALSAAVLVGALAVGDSVRWTLERLSRARLGRAESALDTGARHFRDHLAERLRKALDADAAAALRVRGMALVDREPRRQLNRVDVYGVDRAFFRLAEEAFEADLGAGDVVVGEKLAAALGVRQGDEIALRVSTPGLLSRDAPLASRRDRETRRRTFRVRAVLSDARFGRFSLKSDQAAPYNAFVSLPALQALLEFEGRANVLLAAAPEAALRRALREVWDLEDAGLFLRPYERYGLVQLQTPRIYPDPAVAEKALRVRPGAVGALAYLVNSISSPNGKSTPYSFMVALSPSEDRRLSPVPPDLRDDEILINRWVSDRLAVGPGDRVKVAYSELSEGDAFVEREREFTVRAVLEMESLGAERDLVPEFPGLTDVDRCEEWDIGLPLEERKLKDADNEAYWKAYRQTPKAVVSLAAGRSMWGNRFGDLMTVRYRLEEAPAVRAALRDRLDPEDAGLRTRAVREEAARAVAESTDLGQLFLGMSAFLAAASLVLTGLLFGFTVDQRAREAGTLRALGFTPRQVRGLLLSEGALLAVGGTLAGIPLGLGLARVLVWGLGTAWSGAVARAAVEVRVRSGSILAGAAAAAGLSVAVMALALGRQARRPVRELLAEGLPGRSRSGRARGAKAICLAGAVAAAAVTVGALASGTDRPATAFFAAGTLALLAGLAAVRWILSAGPEGPAAGLTLARLGTRNAGRRPGRSTAAAGMLACGVFLVVSVGAMKEDPARRAGDRRSGTGGFALYGESSVAVHDDLNGERGRRTFRLTDREVLEGVSFVQLRLREGDDASCLNLNQARVPPLLGVDGEAMARRGAFAEPERWRLLEQALPDGAIPALAGDSTTVAWKLKRAALDLTDERGRPFRVRIVGSLPSRLTLFQGRLLISNRAFTRLYPSESGTRVFLAEVPPGREGRVRAYLAERMEAFGADWVFSGERLREFYGVEGTYLTMFLVLGGLGMLLGTAGLGVLVLRNVLERRPELALLRAVGYSPEEALRVVVAEHRFLVGAGLGTGTLAASLAVAPALAQPGAEVPIGFLASLLVAIGVFSRAWIRGAARLALRGPLLPALRNE